MLVKANLELKRSKRRVLLMDVANAKKDMAIRGKKGIAFLSSALLIWLMITAIYMMPLDFKSQNIGLLIATGFMFPGALLASKIIGAEWKVEGNPLADLGLYLNLAQFMYFPILFLAFINRPEDFVVYFAIITGAHLFPYGWLYMAKMYYMIAPVISVGVMVINLVVQDAKSWMIPLYVVCLLLMLVIGLYLDVKRQL